MYQQMTELMADNAPRPLENKRVVADPPKPKAPPRGANNPRKRQIVEESEDEMDLEQLDDSSSD